MSEFNLIDKPWISVVTDYKGTTDLVGLREFFSKAHTYLGLAGDMPTQDFAVMRFLLAILHTVFSRYRADGKVYDEIKVNDRMQQVEPVDMEDYEDYEDALMQTWKDLWAAGKFPHIVIDYLDKWKDRFDLFDDKYPFYQVRTDIIRKVDEGFVDSESNTAIIAPKLMNRTISESMNKQALFSPRTDEFKNDMTDAELVRWLITFQGVSNASDKKSVNDMAGKSIGWIYELGGVFLSSDNMFKTLLLNLILRHSESQYNNIQKPCWEFNQIDLYNKYLNNEIIDNLAELYTNWSRLMYCFNYKGKDPKAKELINKNIFRIVKTNTIEARDMFLEPMTIWKNNEGKYFPEKHEKSRSAWRSFGSIINKNGDQYFRLPGVIDNLNIVKNVAEENELIQINAISAIYDDNSSSRALVDEYYDFFNLELYVATDQLKDGWVLRINDIVDTTKYVVDKIFRSFINDIKSIRNIEASDFTSNYIEAMYYEIDKPFRDWLSSIDYEDNKDEKAKTWHKDLKRLVINQAEKIMKNAGPRDFTGIIENDSIKNIATAFNNFMSRINSKL
ncbi:MAG: type I-E CRISPR-associated protein Cse1/CasA [Ezakiella massiliensis]